MAFRCGDCKSKRQEKIEQTEDRAHARLGPSSASRWLRCPGSVNFLEDNEAEDGGGVPAAEGTILHSFCEDALNQNLDAYSFVGETREHDGFKLTLDDDLADMMQAGLDVIDTLPGKLYVEYRVKLDRWMPGQFGTLDVGLAGKKRIHIWDWKWGFGPVDPVENDQLRIYALGFWDNVARHVTDATDFTLHIWQPRAPGGGGSWNTTLDELLEFGKYVKKQAAATYGKDAPRIPGPKQCQWCDGAKALTCPEYAAYNMALVVADFDDLDDRMEMGVPPRMPKFEDLTPERRSYIIEHKAMFIKFLERLERDTLDDALKGRTTPGLKPVAGRTPPAKWKNEEAARPVLERALEEEAYRKKLITPSQASKLLPGKIFAKLSDFIERGDPKPILVSEHDSRERLKPLEDEFEDLV